MMTLAMWSGLVLLGGLAIFQILLAVGFPLGRFAWGGKHRVLPGKLRISSLASVAILGVAAWILLARAGHVAPGSEPLVVRIIAWVFTGYFGLNVLMNLASKSRLERAIMTPVALLLAACFLGVNLA